MAYLANKAVNRLNLHYGIQALATSGGGVFVGVFLLKAGVPVSAVLCAFAAINAGRYALRAVVLGVAKRWGLKSMVIFGALVLAVQYPILARVHGVDPMLLALCCTTILGETFYWTAYHTYFGQLGDAEHRGHQTGAREAAVAVAGIVGPVAGGWALATVGPAVAFAAVAVIQTIAVLPLLGAPNVPVAAQAERGSDADRQGFMLYLVDGWIGAGQYVVWQIVLFVMLSQSFTAYGGAMALAAFVSALAGLALGRHIDAGRGVQAVWMGVGVLIVTILLRAVAMTPAVAVAANAMGAFVACLYVPTHMTAGYNLAAQSPCRFRFQMAAEGGWDIGRGAGCLIAAGLVALGAPLQATLLVTLAGALTMLVLLRRYYSGLTIA